MLIFQPPTAHAPLITTRSHLYAVKTLGDDRSGPRPDLSTVISRSETVIFQQKFSGAAADLLNANIIARDLGLKEQSQVEDVTPDKGDRDKRRSRIKELFNRGTGRDS